MSNSQHTTTRIDPSSTAQRAQIHRHPAQPVAMSIMLTVAPRDSRRRFDARGVGVAEDGEGSVGDVGDCSRRCGVSHIDAEGCAEVVCDPTCELSPTTPQYRTNFSKVTKVSWSMYQTDSETNMCHSRGRGRVSTKRAKRYIEGGLCSLLQL